MIKTSEDNQKSFLDYISNKYATEPLSMHQRGVLQTLKYNYAEDPDNFSMEEVTDQNGDKIPVDLEVKIAFNFIKNQMDINADKYQKRCEINRENGSRGGRPKKEKTEKTERFYQSAKKPDNENDINNDKDIIGNEKQKDIENKKAQDYHNILMDAKKNKDNQVEITKRWHISINDDDFRQQVILAGKETTINVEKWIKQHFMAMKIGKQKIAEELVKFTEYERLGDGQ